MSLINYQLSSNATYILLVYKQESSSAVAMQMVWNISLIIQ